ncbi:MAG: RluA family pseudouridine synthase [Planctomycetes bacterium]|nr:RluA family pseudouridine synthase [Planctomycetota bacterium]
MKELDPEELLALYERQEGDDETPVTVTFELQRDLDKRLDRYLVDRIPFLSRTSLQQLIHENSITVNGRVPKPSTKLHKGDKIVAVLPPPPSTEVPADDIPLDIVYEDRDLIVVNKQAGLLVHPARSYKRGTLINALAWHFLHRSEGALSAVGKEFARPGVVHRLDRWTTGVMVAAKTDTAHWRIAKQFENRTTEKRYLALVHGTPEPVADMIDLPLGKHSTVRELYAVRWGEEGRPSRTIYRTIERYQGYALVELELLTGRTHQIRVHMSHLGWPLVGDDLYDGKHVPAAELGIEGDPKRIVMDRQALHAAMLRFEHPSTHAKVSFTAAVPADFREIIFALRKKGYEAVDAPGSTLSLEELGLPRSATE